MGGIHMLAQDIMTTRVITVTPGTPLRDAVQLMLEHRISGLPVVGDSGRLVGIVTEADLLLKEAKPHPQPPVLEWFGRSLWLERWLSSARKAEGQTVGDVMTHNVVTADEHTPVEELAARMIRFRVNRLPIVRDGAVVGIVTRADILKVFMRSDETLSAQCRSLVTEFLLPWEEVGIHVDRGVVHVRGRVSSPGRRNELLQRLWSVDGVIAVDDRDLLHGYPAHMLMGE